MINQKILENVSDMVKQYHSASPYPHIVVDNFLEENVLETCLKEMTNFNYWSVDPQSQREKVQVNKFFSPSGLLDDSINHIKSRAPVTYSTLNYLQSNSMLNFLTSLTGIQNLQRDDHFLGAGIHKVTNGGKLAVHADFNRNWNSGLYRRINLLLYLNKDWKEEYGGELQLWKTDLSECVKKVVPTFNRAIIFTTFRNSYHGHPIPMTLPRDVARYSMALYYYTKEPPQNEEVNFRPVDWKTTN
jgi:Rps23 Pro-64 3,4-dihydroxylase Tpa1-like proline 4-hydroxylase